MNRTSNRLLLASLFLAAFSLLQTGCAMCCGTYDYAYAGHGGKWQRSDLFHGRIGSPFSDPNARVAEGQLETLDDSDLEVIE